MPPVLISNDCLMKEPKDFTCLMLVGFKIISSRFVLLMSSHVCVCELLIDGVFFYDLWYLLLFSVYYDA